jgi:hypothetical protein
MILNNGQNMVQPSSGGGGGGLRRLVDIIARNKSMEIALQGRKDLISHQGKTKVETEKAIFEHRADNAARGLKTISGFALKELPSDHPDVINKISTPHPVTGKHYANPVEADQYIKVGAVPTAKGDWHMGPGLGNITQTEKVTARNLQESDAKAALEKEKAAKSAGGTTTPATTKPITKSRNKRKP